MEIKFNTEFMRWEVYSENPLIRGGEPQPDFVSDSFWKCETYKNAVEARK